MMTDVLLDEQVRLAALGRYGAFEKLRADIFDDISRLAAFICQTPMSLITLVDSTRQWFLSMTGFHACETSRDVSFCVHALVGPELLIVPDARADARFAGNPLVTGEPYIRFYTGAPIVTNDGHTLGTLCVVDRVPRDLSREQTDALQALSRMVMAQLEVQRLKQELYRLQERT